jgi:prepilin-type N-terminal cleavage/methylation domain-containing protein
MSRGFAKRAGFTLTEMLIVAGVLAALAAAAVPIISAPDRDRVALAAEQVLQALSFARAEAERTGLPHGARIDTAAETVRLFRLDTTTTPPTREFVIRHPVHRGLFWLDFPSARLTRGVRVDAAALSFSGSCSDIRDVVFDARGWPRCADPTTVELTTAKSDIGKGRTTRRVSVAGVTGRVTVQ